MIETTLLNDACDRASGHVYARRLALGLSRLRAPVQLLIAHLEPGREERIMAEVMTAFSDYKSERSESGRNFEL